MADAEHTQKGNEDKQQNNLELKRKIGLPSGVALIVGAMIGSGIFISPGGVLERTGSVGLSLILWAVCGLISIFGSLAYAELGTLIPKSGGEYAYYLDGMGSLHSFWGPLPAFMYSWIMILLIMPGGQAASSLSVASYIVYPILNAMEAQLEPQLEEILLKTVAILSLSLVIAINCFSVDWTIRISNVFTIAKLGAIAVLIGCGMYQLSMGETRHLALGFQGTTTDLGTIAMAFYGGLWAYDGWNNLNYATEELKNPYVTLPRAIIIGIPLVVCCYLAVNVAYLTVLSPTELVRSSAVAVDVGNFLLGPMAFIIPAAVVMSNFGNSLSYGFSVGRLCFASAREGHLLDALSFIHVESRTPVPAFLFMGFLSILMILAKDLAALIDFCTFTMWIFYVTSMVLVLILRRTRPDARRPYRVPLFIPIIVIIVGSYLIVAPIISNPTLEYLYVLIAILLGFFVYVPFVYYKYTFHRIAPVTRIIQLTLNVGSTGYGILDHHNE